MIKKSKQFCADTSNQQNIKNKPYKNADTVVQHMSITDVHHSEKTEEDVDVVTTYKGHAEAIVDCQWKELATIDIQQSTGVQCSKIKSLLFPQCIIGNNC